MQKSALWVAMLAIALVTAVSAATQELSEEQVEDAFIASPEAAQEAPDDSATGVTAEPRDLVVEPVLVDNLGGTLPVGEDPSFDYPRVLVAPSATALSNTLGVEIPDAGEGTYVAAFRGAMGTPGYFVDIESARLEGDSVTLGISLTGDGGQVTVMDYPYAVAVVREPDLLDKNFYLIDQNGQELLWPVYRVSS